VLKEQLQLTALGLLLITPVPLTQVSLIALLWLPVLVVKLQALNALL